MRRETQSLAWSTRVLIASTLGGCVAIAALAQPVETPVPKTERIGRIQELVEAGQLDMAGAVKLAEKHVKGVAFKARCSVKPGPFADEGGDAQPVPPKEPPELVDERLMYQIVCVVKDKPVTVKIDGKEKKVLSPQTPPTPPGPEPKPDPIPIPKGDENPTVG